MFLNNQKVIEEIKRGKNSGKKWQWEQDNSKPVGYSKTSYNREVYCNTVLPQERRKTSNRHLKQLEDEAEKNPKISRRKEIIKIWAEINEKEMKEATVKINKTKSWFFEKINKLTNP